VSYLIHEGASVMCIRNSKGKSKGNQIPDTITEYQVRSDADSMKSAMHKTVINALTGCR